MIFSQEKYICSNDGSFNAFDEYGRLPGQVGFGKPEKGKPDEWITFQRFQGEFARLFGPYRRGRSSRLGELDNEMDSD